MSASVQSLITVTSVQSPLTVSLMSQPTTLVVSVNRGERGDSGKSGGEFITRFSYGDSTPKLLNTPITGLVDRVLLGIKTPFNVPSTLSIGITNDPSLLQSAGQNLPTEVGQFETSPSVDLTNQQIILTITPGSGISQGSGFVIVEYSTP